MVWRIGRLFIVIATTVKAFVKLTNSHGYKTTYLNSGSDKVELVVNKNDALYKLKRWEHYISNRTDYYPKVSMEAVILGRKFIQNADTPCIMEWHHMVEARNNDLASDIIYFKNKPYKNLVSHMCLGELSNTRKKYFIHGIVENPENVLHEFSIHGFLYRLQRNGHRRTPSINIDISNLKNWCYGIYHFSLTRDFEKKS